MEHEDQVSRIPIFPARPRSPFSFSDHRSIHRPSSTHFDADGASISDMRRPPTSESHRRRFRVRNPSLTRNRIMDRGRRSYFEHAAQPSKSSNRRDFASGIRRENGDQMSIHNYRSTVYEPPQFEIEKRLHEQESIPPRTAKGGEYLGEKAQSPRRRRVIVCVHILLAVLFTGWWIASLLLHRNDRNWVIPLLIWMSVMIRLFTFHVYAAWLMSPIYFIWDELSGRIMALIPRRLQHPIAGIIVGAIIILSSMLSPEFGENTRTNRAIGLLGYGLCITLLWATSRNRRMMDWHTVIVGILTQFLLGILMLRARVGKDAVSWVSQMCRQLLENANTGLVFVTDNTTPNLPWLAMIIVPPLIFLAGLAHVLSYWGILSWMVRKSAAFFWWSLRVSGVEAVVAITSPFLGIGQAVLLIRPFLPYITNSELHQILCSSFATVGGNLLVAYANLGVNSEVLISSCVMSIPTSFVVSKLRYPEEEEPFAVQYVTNLEMMRDDGASSIQAFTNGLWLGLKLAAIIFSAFLGIIALVALLDILLTWAGEYINITSPLTLELILGYLLYPVSFLLGVPRNGDLFRVSRLIGFKILKSELVAFQAMQSDPAFAALSTRSHIIATYALCGFGNLGALGAQVGILSQMSPQRSGDIARVAGSAWVSGIISTLLTASMAGILITDQTIEFPHSIG